MFAPPVPAASSDIKSTEKEALVSESTTLSQLCFPNEFPYEFAFTSPEDSTEKEDEKNDDEDDFIAGLTRRLALFTQRIPSPPPFVTDKAKLNSTESTLSQLGSSTTTSGNRSPNGPFSQAPSRPESPVASGVVAKIKVANFVAKPKSRPNPKPNSFTPFAQNAAFYNYYYYWWLRQPLFTYPYPVRGVFPAPNAVKQPSNGTGVFSAPNAVKQQSTTAPNAVKRPSTSTGVFASPNAVKQPSAGTGVFLPRNCTNPSGSKKKAGGCVKLPTKVVPTQHSKTEKSPGRIQSPGKLDGGGSLKEGRHLPQEWVY